MGWKRFFQKKERGQATLETMLMLPLELGVLFLGLAIAVLWHAHALSAQLALEGASRDGANPGSGVGFVIEKKGSVAPSFSIGPITWTSPAGVEGENEVFSMDGQARIPWSPFGLNLTTIVRTAVTAPVWKFQP